MAKKFNEQLKAKKESEKKIDVTNIGAEMLSDQAAGRKRKYTKLQNKENKTKIVTVLLTETEYNDLLSMCEELNKKSISESIREMIHSSLNAYQSKLIK